MTNKKQKNPKPTRSSIVQQDDPVLRKIAREVPISDIGSSEINNILEKMKVALHLEEDGVAIAAPQIGESVRIFVVSGKALLINSKKHLEEKDGEPDDLVFINPVLVKISKKKKKLEEGCLSVRWLYGKVDRSEKVTLKAFDEYGQPFERGASGLMSQIFQHEIDHLNGILFIDKAEDIENIPPQEN